MLLLQNVLESNNEKFLFFNYHTIFFIERQYYTISDVNLMH